MAQASTGRFLLVSDESRPGLQVQLKAPCCFLREASLFSGGCDHSLLGPQHSLGFSKLQNNVLAFWILVVVWVPEWTAFLAASLLLSASRGGGSSHGLGVHFLAL